MISQVKDRVSVTLLPRFNFDSDLTINNRVPLQFRSYERIVFAVVQKFSTTTRIQYANVTHENGNQEKFSIVQLKITSVISTTLYALELF